MAFNSDKAFEATNGVILNGDGSAGLFSDGGTDPSGNDAPVGSKYLGSDGTFWTKEGVGVNDWKRQGRGKTISGSLTNGNTASYLIQTGSVYSPFSEILWPGSDSFGEVACISVLIRTKNANKAAAVRVYDVTNNQVIAEIASFQSNVFNTVDMGTIVGTPSATSANWQLQGKRVDNGGEAWCAAFLIEN